MFCWNPQDFHFCINYRFSDGLRPSWPQRLCSVEFLLSGKLIEQLWKIKRLFPPSFELGTFRVWGERDDHYTTETCSQDWGTFPSLASWNTTQTTDCVALFNLQIPSIFSSKLKKIPVFCWNPQDFHFCINYSFSDGLSPSWPQSLCSVEVLIKRKLIEQLWKIKRLFPPSFELGTFRVWGERDDHYTTETCSQDWGTFPSLASWNTNQTTDCVALFNLQIPSIFSSKQKKFQCSAGILKTFIFASTTGLATVFVPLGRKAFVVLSSSSAES